MEMIRGVNLGGWLVPERYITPSLFATTNCTGVSSPGLGPGPGSSSGPGRKSTSTSTSTPCAPLTPFPVDLHSLSTLLGPQSTSIHLKSHYETFLTRADISKLHSHNVTHLRVPLPHYIFSASPDEPYVSDHIWSSFCTLVEYVREVNLQPLQIQIWVDLHTAPGSQNGFDNSAFTTSPPTCKGWSNSPPNILRTLAVIDTLATAIVSSNFADVVTGFGVLNEPFVDCDRSVVEKFNDDAFSLVRDIMPPSTTIIIGDMFNASTFADRKIWSDPLHSDGSALDSHYYHVFSQKPRGFSPRQHVAYVCEKNFRDATSCCGPNGMGRIIGEWSAAFDTLVCAKLDDVMLSYEDSPDDILEHDRQISQDRRAFLR